MPRVGEHNALENARHLKRVSIMTSYEFEEDPYKDPFKKLAGYVFVGEDPNKQLAGYVGVRGTSGGGISVRADSWFDEFGTVKLTAEQAKELIRIIEAHLPGAEGEEVAVRPFRRLGVDLDCVGREVRDQVCVEDWRPGIRVLVSGIDNYAKVNLTAEQAKELIRVIKAHLPDAE